MWQRKNKCIYHANKKLNLLIIVGSFFLLLCIYLILILISSYLTACTYLISKIYYINAQSQDHKFYS